jgi:hypothetical protein
VSSILRKEVPSLILYRLIFKYTSSLLAIIIYLKTRTNPLSPIFKGLNFFTFLLKSTLSCILFYDPAHSRFSKHKTYSHCPCLPPYIAHRLKSISLKHAPPRHRPSHETPFKHPATTREQVPGGSAVAAASDCRDCVGLPVPVIATPF